VRYGRPFVYWLGPRPRVTISDPELVKVIMTDSTGGFDKAGSGGNNLLARQLIGEGLVGITGEKWARHRRVIAPSFNMESQGEDIFAFYFSRHKIGDISH
jgi:cytochrome P450